ncbi:MAG: ABC transporter permease, partial [Pseudomonadota bacterium]
VTGDIVKAVDLGIEGAAQFSVEFELDTWIKTRKAIVLFKCDTTDLYDLVDPRYLIALDKLSFFDPGNAEPFAYGYCLAADGPEERISTASPYASVFAKSGRRVKFGASSDILGQRMLFLNAPSPDTKKVSEGLGYDVAALRLVQDSSYQVLRDMYHLDENRMRVLKRYGIDNRRLERLHSAARENLEQAGAAMKERRWDQQVKHARRGLGIESRAYPDVRGTSDDVIKGIVFYMALLLPFAFFCERLFFAFPDLKRRLVALVAFFIVTYLALRLVHPAFRIVETAEVILLGLVILVLCGIVVVITAGRFETQMRTMKQQLGRVHHADVSRASATATAFALGVSNMRRRKVRTFLTCTAIVLLMFTVLSFTSVKTYLRPRKLQRPNTPAYQGALIRDRTWVPMRFLALEHLSSEFEDAGLLVRRSWLGSRTLDEPRLTLSVRSTVGERIGPAGILCFGLVGFDPAETEVSGLNTTLKSGRWFRPDDRNVCILPDFIAEALNVQADNGAPAQVHLQGMTLTVIGIVDSEKYNDFVDLDNERLTPIDFTTLSREALQRASRAAGDVSAVEGRAALETFIHIDARNIVFLPYETVLDLGGTLQSVAVKFRGGSVGEHIERLLDRLAVTVFVGEGERTLVYSSLASSSVGGMANILVPVLIAALMILNTMSGSVHERFQEIGTYSSVGLAPTHIGALFLAEACVYAILGGIAGYVLGQVLTRALMAMGFLGGLTLNYSSLASVMATVVVMITVVASTLYPARMAARMAVPDVTRKWVIPKPKGDEWFFDFPFTVGGKEVTGLYVFFRYYFASFEEQSVGRFYTADTRLAGFSEAGQDGYQLQMRVWLAPYDLGVSQDVELRAVPSGDFGVYSIQLKIKRLSGEGNMWVRTNRGFLDQMRKQFLLWRTISAEGKGEYMAEAQQIFAGTEA